MLEAISPIDGRYNNKTKELSPYFSEYALFKYRVQVEVEYFIALSEKENIVELDATQKEKLRQLYTTFTTANAARIKEIEAITNHDVKATEYYIKENLSELDLETEKEWIHFGLTSQDINNTAVPLSLKEALRDVYYPMLQEIISIIEDKAALYKTVAMLARTHGQPASPTSLGKELMVYVERLTQQLSLLENLPIKAKFGGATGNLNAHKVSFPDKDWLAFSDTFVTKYLGLERSRYTTQIAHYDHLAAIFDNIRRINTILIDLCRDIWTYISMEYFTQRIIATEVGSSAMPHKVNPIDFENAEGNLGIANAIFSHLSDKLPISRLQRDLTDSTVLRNLGVPIAHTLIAFKSFKKGMSKIDLNAAKLESDLNNNWAVVAEAIQNILRREQYPKPYEKLKELTRGNQKINDTVIQDFIQDLDVPQSIKEELQKISPFNYIGYS
jgi:adenylosuccinate lyase